MFVYGEVVMFFNFVVDFLLLYGARRLSGSRCVLRRLLCAAGVGAVYAGICLVPTMHFIGNTLWRCVSLVLMCVVAYGMDKAAIRAGGLFMMLSMALGGIVVCLQNPGPGGTVLWAVLLAVGCGLWVRAGSGKQSFAQVCIRHNGAENRFMALRDTGNTLRDPVTGDRVLVAGADIADKLLGLSPNELMDPVGTMASGKYRGLRLIPYRTVGQTGQMLLGVLLDEVWVDGEQVGRLVAFAPQVLGNRDGYQALTGG